MGRGLIDVPVVEVEDSVDEEQRPSSSSLAKSKLMTSYVLDDVERHGGIEDLQYINVRLISARDSRRQ